MSVVEELGSPGLNDRSDDRAPNEAEIAPLDEEDLLSGDWGIPTPPGAAVVDATDPTSESAATQAIDPETPIETTPAYVLDPPAISLDDDFWDEPVMPTLIDSAAIEVAASAIADPEVADPEPVQNPKFQNHRRSSPPRKPRFQPKPQFQPQQTTTNPGSSPSTHPPHPPISPSPT